MHSPKSYNYVSCETSSRDTILEYTITNKAGVGMKILRDTTIASSDLNPLLWSVPNLIATPSMLQPVTCTALPPSSADVDSFILKQDLINE